MLTIQLKPHHKIVYHCKNFTNQLWRENQNFPLKRDLNSESYGEDWGNNKKLITIQNYSKPFHSC